MEPELRWALGIGIVSALLSLLASKENKLLWAFVTFVFGFTGTTAVTTDRSLRELHASLNTTRASQRLHDPVLRKYAVKLQTEADTRFASIRDGIVMLDRDKDMMEAYYDVFQTATSGETIDAVSVVSIPLVWGRARGDRALEVNREASRRGVAIRRIFIFSSKTELDANRTYLAKQIGAGVEVFVVLRARLNPDLMRDFLVTSSGTSLEFLLDGDGNISSARLSRSDSMITGLSSRFREIAASAEPLTKH